MGALTIITPVVKPSVISARLSIPIFRLPFAHREHKSKFTKAKLTNYTSISSSVSTEEETKTGLDEHEKFDWFSQWYAVMPVCDLDKRAPCGKKVMGLDVVVWWDKNQNAWKVFDDMCPHRLAPLSEGRIDQWGRLQCTTRKLKFSNKIFRPKNMVGSFQRFSKQIPTKKKTIFFSSGVCTMGGALMALVAAN
ncbi:hypothetical protein R6Q59_007616 [Mikania micrantha]